MQTVLTQFSRQHHVVILADKTVIAGAPNITAIVEQQIAVGMRAAMKKHVPSQGITRKDTV